MERKVEGVTPEYSLVSHCLKGRTQGEEFFFSQSDYFSTVALA